MDEVARKLKEQYEAANADAQKAWEEFDKFRQEKGEEALVGDNAAFDAAHELHGAYGEKADVATDLHARLMKALEWNDDPGIAKHVLAPDVTKDSPVAQYAAKAGKAFVESESYKALKASGVLNHSGHPVSMQPVDVLDREETKALVKGLVTGASSTSGGAFIINDRQAGMIELPRDPRPVTALITVGDTDSDTVEWVEQTARVNAAAELPEATTTADTAADAPESGFDLVVKTTTVKEIRHMIPATRISLADSGQVRSIIDDELREGLLDRLERQVLLGTGTGVNLLGLLPALTAIGAGVTITAGAGEPDVEAVHKALTQIALSNYMPERVLFGPLDWEGIRLAKDTTGNYYYGPPSTVGANTVWGYPSSISPLMPVNTALAGSFSRGAKLWMREGVSVSATDSHADWFRRGVIAMMAGMRCAFALQRPLAFRKIVFTT